MTNAADHPRMAENSGRGRVVVACVVVTALLLLHCAYYYPFLSDDALIAMRYARRFADGRGLTFTADERVEGYTDFLWVLLLALGDRLGADPITCARVLGILGAVAGTTACVVWGACSRALGVGVSAGLFYAASAPLAVWTIGGLEHGLMAGALTVALVLLARETAPHAESSGRRRTAGGLLAALTLLRADGVVLAIATTAGDWLACRPRARAARRALALCAPSLGVWMAQAIFRLWYYDALLPNTAVAKVAASWSRVALGVTHVRDASTCAGVLLLSATLGAFSPATGRARWVFLAPALGWTAYVALVGGDIFPAWRQLSLAYPPLALLAAHGLDGLAKRLGARTLGAATLGAAAIIAHAGAQTRDAENRRGKTERWEFDGAPLGRMLAVAFGARAPLLAVDAAGALPYFSDLPTLDMLGLTNRHISHARPAGSAPGPIGHDLGDGRYVWQRRPDLIAFCGSIGNAAPCFRGGRELWAMPRFRSTYRLARFHPLGTHIAAPLYVRADGGVLGIARNLSQLAVPAWHLGDSGRTLVELDAHGRVGMRVAADSPARIEGLDVPAGSWRVSVDAERSARLVALACARPRRVTIATFSRPTTFDFARGTHLDVSVGTQGADALVFGLTFDLVPTAHGLAVDCDALATRRLERSFADLAGEPRARAYWASPAHVVFSERGLRVAPWPGEAARAFDLSVDGNDDYLLEFGAPEGVLYRTRLAPGPRTGGMAVHHLAVPPQAAGASWLDITPLRGDGRYSVGAIRIAW